MPEPGEESSPRLSSLSASPGEMCNIPPGVRGSQAFVSISECLWFPTPRLAGEGKVQKRSNPECDENQGREMDAWAGAPRVGGRGGLLGIHEEAGRDLNEFFPVTHVLTFF